MLNNIYTIDFHQEKCLCFDINVIYFVKFCYQRLQHVLVSYFKIDTTIWTVSSP